MRRIAPIAIVLVLASTGACRNGQKRAGAKEQAAHAAAGRHADLFFTTGTLGYIEPCGCTSKPLGGLQRLASVVRGSDRPSALIDAGSLLFPDKVDSVTHDQHVLKSRILARAYRKLGAVAINLGPSDLAVGRAFLAELQREGAVPFISANVRPVGEGGPTVAQSFLREIGGIKIGLTGVATPEDFPGTGGITAIEYAPVLRAEVMSLSKRGAELVIVLAHVSDAGARDIARAVPGIDIVIRSPGTAITAEPAGPTQVGDVWVVEAGSQGQRVGRLRIELGTSAPRRPVAFDDGGYALRKRHALVERKISALERQIEAWRGDDTRAQAIDARKEQIARLRADLGKQTSPVATEGPHIRFDLIDLTEQVSADRDMQGVLEAYYTQLKAMNMDKGDVTRCKPTSTEAPTYVGTAECVECHEEAHDFWKKTKHAVAWKTLEDQDKHFDLTCIGCHTIGYEKPGGFCKLSDVGVLKDVGCENCHGPGSTHVEDSDPDSIRLSVTESTCAGECHVPEHSDTFEFQKYLREITGEGHTLSSASLKP